MGNKAFSRDKAFSGESTFSARAEKGWVGLGVWVSTCFRKTFLFIRRMKGGACYPFIKLMNSIATVPRAR
jgi:hypothetical protein